jgi:hypothetical protein
MSNIVTDKIIPDSGSSNTLTIGGTGDSVVVLDSLNLNSLQDAGGNNIFVSDGSGTVTSKNSGLSGALNLISTQTASGSASLSFTSGLDSTYDVYCFKFIDINPSVAGTNLTFQAGSGYNETITSAAFAANHHEDNDPAELAYTAGEDQGQGTAYQTILANIGNDADQCGAGDFYLYSPSSTTFVKHFYGTSSSSGSAPAAYNSYIAGYLNTTTALTQVNFKMSSGNFDGIIKLYGISKS